MDPQLPVGKSTIIQHFGEDEKYLGSVVPPLVHNSLFTFEDYEAFESGMSKSGRVEPYIYSRNGNPTVQIAEKKIAELEGAETAKLVQGGAAALSSVVLDCLQNGNHIVCVETAYGTSKWTATALFGRYGVEVTNVDGRNTQELLDAIRPDTCLIVLESPSGCIFYLQDIEAITKVAREKGIPTMFDNTYSTPIFQNPLSMGIDYVVHSCSKYLGGHSDIIGGVVCSTEERISRIHDIVCNLGSILSPFPAWLLIRGMRTLDVRIRRHEKVALNVASWLESLPQIDTVRHPGLPSFDQRDLFLKQMRGTGGLFSIKPACQDFEKLKVFINHLQIYQRAISWGGFESLAVLMKMQLIGMKNEEFYIRLFCGLEDEADLIADLKQAMEKAEL